MAQFFYDFKDTLPGSNLPNGLTDRIFPLSANFEFDISKLEDGIEIWLRNSASGTGNFTSSVMYGPAVSAQDCECLVRLVGTQYNGGSFFNDGPTFVCRAQTTGGYTDGYEISWGGLLSASSVFIRRRVSSSNTTILSSGTNPAGISRESPVWLRAGVSGSTIRMKSWADGQPEPAGWELERTDTNITAAGVFFFGIRGASGSGFGPTAGTKYRIFQLSFGTDGDSAPSSVSLTVTGSLTTPSATIAVGYIVRCYNRDTGALLDETMTDASGNFSFTVSSEDRVYCMAVDQLGNMWNAPIRDLITPS